MSGNRAVRCPTCPLCGSQPAITAGRGWACCDVETCPVMTWDPTAEVTDNLRWLDLSENEG